MIRGEQACHKFPSNGSSASVEAWLSDRHKKSLIEVIRLKIF